MGLKRSDGQLVNAGSILDRQRGTKFIPAIMWVWVKMIFICFVDGYVAFERKGKSKKQVSVYSTVVKSPDPAGFLIWGGGEVQVELLKNC